MRNNKKVQIGTGTIDVGEKHAERKRADTCRLVTKTRALFSLIIDARRELTACLRAPGKVTGIYFIPVYERIKGKFDPFNE